MKKLLCLLLVIICGLMLWSCQGSEQTPLCYSHTDSDDNLRCDDCGEIIDCTKHVDVNDNLACDKCGKTIKCTHRDDNNDGVCDVKVCRFVLCEHEFEEYYSHDEFYHYYANSCGCDIEPAEKAPHTDTNNDRVCDTCEWNFDHIHAYEENWSHNETQHWFNVTCNHNTPPKSLGDHVDENNDSLCDVCAWDYGHTHEYGEAWTHDESQHWHEVTCNHNIPQADRGDHEDKNNDGICDVCLWDYDHVHEYAQGDEWTYDETGHWHAAKCGHDIEGIDYAEHKEVDGLCEVCAYLMCDNHTFDETEWEHDENTHWHPAKCGHSSATMEPAGHSYDTTIAGWKVCQCGYCPHYTSEFSFDKNNHWFAKNCQCEGIEAVSKVEAHTDADNDGVCEVCLNQFCNHYWGEWQREGDYHWQKKQCSHVGVEETSAKVRHSEADKNNDGICDACTVSYCAHDYRNIYSYDTEWHWFGATCGHDVSKDKAAHTDGDNDGICDTCDYQFCDHPYTPDNWGRSEEYHWIIYNCTHTIAPVYIPHIDTNNDGVCDDCNYISCFHIEAEFGFDKFNHWHQPICGHVGVEITDKEAHVDEIGGINGGKDGKCDVCGYVLHEHEYSDNFTTFDLDENGTYETHGRLPICGCDILPADYMTHRESEEEGCSDGYCNYCYELDETGTKIFHQYCTHQRDEGQGYQYDKETHWYVLTCGCDDDGKGDPHVDTDDNNGVCDICKYQFCDHWDKETWVVDDTHKHHWHARTCGHNVAEKIDYEDHIDENYDEICDICKHYCEFDNDSFNGNDPELPGTTGDNLTPPAKEDEDETP